MGTRRYVQRLGEDYASYAIAGVPIVSFDNAYVRDMPPIKIYRLNPDKRKKLLDFSKRTQQLDFDKQKYPLDESFRDYCYFYVNDGDEYDEGLYETLLDNLIPILRGEMEGWKVVGAEVDAYSTFIFVMNEKERYGGSCFICLKPGKKRLDLLFENEDNTFKYHYTLHKKSVHDRRTQLTMYPGNGKFKRLSFSESETEKMTIGL